VTIEITGLTHAYGDAVSVRDLSLTIEDGEFLVLLGPSGCGKTTTMRCVVGLERPQAGTIRIGGRTVFDAGQRIDVPANKRNTGMVFQSYAVWPHKTVYENVAFPLQMQKLDKAETRERVEETLELVGLTSMTDRGASALSGGQMQRVALARSLVMRPAVLLLDEPLSNLDAKLRERLRVELKEIQIRLGVTTIYVTHDQTEALAMADRIAVMNRGVIERLDDAVSIYRSPRTRFVADFVGSSNLLRARVRGPRGRGSTLELADAAGLTFASDDPATERAEVDVSVRPEDVRIGSADGAAQDAAGDGGGAGWDATVTVVSFMGSQVRYVVHVDGGPRLEAVCAADHALRRVGERVRVRLPPEQVQILADRPGEGPRPESAAQPRPQHATAPSLPLLGGGA
jgi:iron(III) transport system ATP-binding protein